MKLITFSGIDKSGKTTLVQEFNNKTNYFFYVIERTPSCVMFFGKLLKRPCRNNFVGYNNFLADFRNLDALHIFLMCEPIILRDRFKKTNEPELPGDLSITMHQQVLFKEWSDANYPNPLIINTSYRSPSECVKLIIEKGKLNYA